MTDKLQQMLDALEDQPRLLVEASLHPVQGDRFQPTGFPDLGAAVYKRPDGTPMLLVESAQSMANRLEAVCWDDAKDEIAEPLKGLPHVVVDLGNTRKTSSIREAHRLNSIYIITDKVFRENLLTSIQQVDGGEVNRRALAKGVFKLDPCSLLHGVFFARKDIAGGRARLQRLLSSFIEAINVAPATSGGVKNETVDPTGVDALARYSGIEQKKNLDAAKSIPYPRTEYVAESVVAYFNLDLASMRGYGLGDPANRLLVALSIYKIVKFLEGGMRLRTACDFELKCLAVKRPEGLSFAPSVELLQELQSSLPNLIKDCDFGESPKTLITAPTLTEKALKKAREALKKAEKEKDVSTDNAAALTNPEGDAQ
ncbi:MAG: type I-U CRISPR-associated RAMP protein Csb1/Cas7u [Acidobacteriota bacterium]